jgi:hypothetical protein
MWQRIEAEIDAPAARPVTRWQHSPAWYIGLAAAMLIALSWVLLARKVSQEGMPAKRRLFSAKAPPCLRSGMRPTTNSNSVAGRERNRAGTRRAAHLSQSV